MNGIKLAARRAKAAPDAAVLVHRGRAAPKAAPCLCLNLLLGQGLPKIVEGSLRIPCLMSRHLTGRTVIGRHLDVILIQLLKFPKIAADGQGLSLVHIAVHRLAGLLAVCNGINGKPRSVTDVSADEDIRLLCLEGHRIMHRATAAAERNLCILQKVPPLCRLSDGLQHTRAGNGKGLLLVVLRVKAPVCILYLCAALKYNSGHFLHRAAVRRRYLLRQDFLRAPAVFHNNAFADSILDLILCGRHFLFAFQAQHGHGSVRAARRRSGHIHRNIAASDDNHITGQLHRIRGTILRQSLGNLLQEGNTGLYALCILPGNAGLSSALQTDGEIERLIPLLAQLRNGDILSDLNAAPKFHAHLTQHIDLGAQHILLQAEIRNAVHQHAAGLLLLLKNGDVVSAFPQIVCAGHAGRAGTDHCHLIFRSPELALRRLAERNIAVFLMKLFFCNKLLDLVNCDGSIHGSSGAGVLAAPVADRAADRRERIVLLDQLQCIHIAAFARHLYIALYGKMGGAGCFAGSGTGIVAVDLRILAVMDVPVVRGPLLRIRKKGLRILHLGAVLPAKLLTELGCTDRTDLHALAAGNALLLLHVCAVRRAGEVRRVVQLGGTQGIADTGRTVADRDDLILTVNIGHLMHEAVALCALQNLQHLVVGNITPGPSRDTEFRHVSDTDAVLARCLAVALAAHFLLPAAGAQSDGIFVVLVQPMGNMLDADGFALGLNGLLHRNDVHADAGAAQRNHGSHPLQRHLRHQVEEGCQVRMLLRQRLLHHHELGRAGNKDRHIVLALPVFILAVHLDHADPDQMVDHPLCLFHAHAVHLGQRLNAVRHARLFETQHEPCFFLRQHLIQCPVLRIVGLQRMPELHRIAVRNHLAEALDQCFLLLVRCRIIRVLTVIPLIHHAVLLFLHRKSPPAGSPVLPLCRPGRHTC